MHGEIKPPDTWPEPPREMSVSSLRAIESCPRRWALSTASYPNLWRGIGYPAADSTLVAHGDRRASCDPEDRQAPRTGKLWLAL